MGEPDAERDARRQRESRVRRPSGQAPELGKLRVAEAADQPCERGLSRVGRRRIQALRDRLRDVISF
jgi:hypothetical protein